MVLRQTRNRAVGREAAERPRESARGRWEEGRPCPWALSAEQRAAWTHPGCESQPCEVGVRRMGRDGRRRRYNEFILDYLGTCSYSQVSS